MTTADDLPEKFRAWALDPARTNDELFTVELLLERTRDVWRSRHKIYVSEPYAEREARVRERAGNPAWRPRFVAEQFEQAAEVWEGVLHLWAWHSNDRAMRDVQALRFFPNLTEVTLHAAEVADLSPLADLSKLRKLQLEERPPYLFSNGCGSLEPLSRLEGLESLHLSIRLAWPDLSVLGRMPSLTTLHYRGNPLALETIPALPRVRAATLHADFTWATPLRTLCALPEMPELEILTLENTDDLAGIERFPKLLNVSLKGPFRSLEPLTALGRATFLSLEGERFRDVSPLIRMPALRQVLFVREEPLALDSLVEAPALREVRFERCTILRTELAAVNAALGSWSEVFLRLEPRALPPLRFITYHPQHAEVVEYWKLNARSNRHVIPELEPDPALTQRHSEWFYEETNRRLDELLGSGWKTDDVPGYPTISRYQDTVRFREIVAVLRAFLGECLYPLPITLRFQPHGDLADEMDDIAARQEAGDEEKDWLDRPFDAEQQREDHEEFMRGRRAEFERRARAHRLRLLEEQGVPIDPAEFSTTPEPPREKVAAGDVPDSPAAPAFDEDDEDEDEEGGGLAIPPPPNDDASEFVQDLSFLVHVSPAILWVTEHMRENAEYHWGGPAENWHDLPGPLGERPAPQ